VLSLRLLTSTTRGGERKAEFHGGTGGPVAASAAEPGCHDPVMLRGGMGARVRAAALALLEPDPAGAPLLVVATGSYIGEGFDCPVLDRLFLAAPMAFNADRLPAANTYA
jgi:hypothetical protein